MLISWPRATRRHRSKHGAKEHRAVDAAAALINEDWSSRSRALRKTCAAYQAFPTLSSKTPRATGKQRFKACTETPSINKGSQRSSDVPITTAPKQTIFLTSKFLPSSSQKTAGA